MSEHTDEVERIYTASPDSFIGSARSIPFTPNMVLLETLETHPGRIAPQWFIVDFSTLRRVSPVLAAVVLEAREDGKPQLLDHVRHNGYNYYQYDLREREAAFANSAKTVRPFALVDAGKKKYWSVHIDVN